MSLHFLFDTNPVALLTTGMTEVFMFQSLWFSISRFLYLRRFSAYFVRNPLFCLSLIIISDQFTLIVRSVWTCAPQMILTLRVSMTGSGMCWYHVSGTAMPYCRLYLTSLFSGFLSFSA